MEERAGLPIIAFADAERLETFLANQAADAPGVWIKFAKQGSGEVTIGKTEAIDAALCHGWIDGQLDKYDDRHWLIRFTPRRPRSRWSAVNARRAVELIDAGKICQQAWRRFRWQSRTAVGMPLMHLPARSRHPTTSSPKPKQSE